MHNNIFGYGTSELTQDAFICYLLSFAMRDYEAKDPVLASCARQLLRKMLNGQPAGELVVTDIKRQTDNVDVLVIVNGGTYIIIEDKTFSGTHGNQISLYEKAIGEKYNTTPVCVYYKIVEQAHPEPNAVNITRSDLLGIFSEYSSQDTVYRSYIEYLKYIDCDVNSWRELPIGEWREKANHAYRGFFTHLTADNIINSRGSDSSFDWYYVSNANGGFWCLWWYSRPGVLHEIFPAACDYLENLYLQIEDDRIAVKLSLRDKDSGRDAAETVRRELFEYFAQTVPGFSKKASRPGAHITVGFVKYDKTDYKEKIKQMETAMDNIR
jgi:hypothetical protein